LARFEDHFSKRAADYARHRPGYPPELFAWLASVAPGRRLAWDCGTGNGQAAVGLAEHFERVIANDASADQLRLSMPHERVDYRLGRAEDVQLAPGTVDLVTVAAAIHWFDFDAFYDVVRLAVAAGGVLAAWVYHQPAIEPRIDAILTRYTRDVIGGYWPERFVYVDGLYRNLPFPFAEVAHPSFAMHAEWDLERLAAFIATWSGALRYREVRGHDPVDQIRPELEAAWGDPRQSRPIRWPLHMRVGLVG